MEACTISRQSALVCLLLLCHLCDFLFVFFTVLGTCQTDPHVLFFFSLRFMPRSNDPTAKGKFQINAQSQMVPSANKPYCWRLTTEEVPTGVLLYASCAAEKRMWMDALRHAINAKHKEHRDSIRSSFSLSKGQRPSLLQEIKHGRNTSNGMLLRSGVSPEDLC